MFMPIIEYKMWFDDWEAKYLLKVMEHGAPMRPCAWGFLRTRIFLRTNKSIRFLQAYKTPMSRIGSPLTAPASSHSLLLTSQLNSVLVISQKIGRR